jgi:hypothetical protein
MDSLHFLQADFDCFNLLEIRGGLLSGAGRLEAGAA